MPNMNEIDGHWSAPDYIKAFVVFLILIVFGAVVLCAIVYGISFLVWRYMC